MGWSCHQRHTDVGSCGACAIGLELVRLSPHAGFCLTAGRAQTVTPIYYDYGKGTRCHPGLLREGYVDITPRVLACTSYLEYAFWTWSSRKIGKPIQGLFTIKKVYANGTVKVKCGLVTERMNIRRLHPYHLPNSSGSE